MQHGGNGRTWSRAAGGTLLAALIGMLGLAVLASPSAQAASEPLAAEFTAGKAVNAAALNQGATVVRADVYSTGTYYRGENALDEHTGTYWYTAGNSDQEIVVDLGREWLVDRLHINTSRYGDGVQGYEVQLSTAGTDPAHFTTVATGVHPAATYESTSAFAPTTARYFRFVVASSHGASRVRINELSLRTPDREGGIASLLEGPTAAAEASSWQYHPPSRAIDDSESTYWRTAFNQVAGEHLTVTLPSGPHTVERVALRGGSSTSYHPDSFEVLVSTTGTDPAHFTSVLSANLVADGTRQEFSFPPVSASHVRLLIHSNHGYPGFVLVADFDVLNSDGANLGSGSGVGGEVVDVSNVYSNHQFYDGSRIHAYRPSRWLTASGHNTNQHLTLRLSPLVPDVIDQVDVGLPSNTSAPKNVEIKVSTTGTEPADFTVVAGGTIAGTTGTASFSFPPVAATYVQLFVIDNHGHDRLEVRSLRVWSPSLGEASVRFVDRSTGDVTGHAWDFGDGTSSGEAHPHHTFSAPGTYTVSLTVTDGEGASSTMTRDYTVLGPPDASFTASPTSADEGSFVSFTPTSTDVLDHAWDFGDGYSNTQTSPWRRYVDDGIFTVRHTATGRNLLTATATTDVTIVNVAPTVNAGNDLTEIAGEAVLTQPSFSDPGYDTHTCTWSWGDGTADTVVNSCRSYTADQAHTYSAPGTYTATLTVVDDDGGSASDTITIDVTRRPTFIHVVDAVTSPAGLEVSARLYDEVSMEPIAGEALTFHRDTDSQVGVTDANGDTAVTFPGASADPEIEADFAGNALNLPTSSSRKVHAPAADLVFMIDESGSMGDDQDAVRARVADVARQLASEVDFRIGIVGYGGYGAHGPPGHIHTPLTNDLGQVADALDGLLTNGGVEPGFNATVTAMGDDMGFRERSGVCATIITDEDADVGGPGSGYEETKADALSALQARHGVFFSVVGTGGQSEADYGPDPGSLSAETGGTTFSLTQFRHDPDPVVQSLLDDCVAEVLRPDLHVTVTDHVDDVIDSDPLTYEITVTNVGANRTTGIELTHALPEQVVFATAGDDGTHADGVVTWPAFALESGETVVRTVSAAIGGDLPAGEHVLTSTAAVHDDGVNGDDRNPDDNVATDLTDLYMRPDTTTAPEPSIARVLSQDDTAVVFLPELIATLVDETGGAVVGRTIDFSVGGELVCSGVTDDSGTARCEATIGQELAVVLALGYDAEFAGDRRYRASAARGALVEVLDLAVPGDPA